MSTGNSKDFKLWFDGKRKMIRIVYVFLHWELHGLRAVSALVPEA